MGRVQRRGVIKAVLAAALLALVLPASANAYEPRVPQTFFGISHPDLWSLTESNQTLQRDAQLDQIKAAGFDWVRIEVGWRELEPNPPSGGTHSYNWAVSDRLVTAMAQRGLELMAMPMVAPKWAADADASAAGCDRTAEPAVDRTDDYAAFVGALLRRYGVNGTFWTANPTLPKVPVRRLEIWNEPNWDSFWCPQPNPELYGKMLLEAADAAHAVDPGAQVILGGLAALQGSDGNFKGMAADEFLQRAVAAAPRLGQALDAAAVHPYDIDPDVNISLVGWFRRQLDRAGVPGAEIVLTEFGWRTGATVGALTEEQRTRNYEVFANQIPRLDCGVTAVAAHSWRTQEINPLDPEHWWGLTSPLTGELYPSGVAYRDQAALFEGRGPTPAPRDLIPVCGDPTPPDQDGDGAPDHDDDYPLDPARSAGSGEVAPRGSEYIEPIPRTHVPRVPDDTFGVSMVQLPSDFSRLGDDFAAVRSIHSGVVRMRVDWSRIEPVPPSDPSYAIRADWLWMDRVTLKLGLQGIRLVPAFGSAPEWAPKSGAAFDSEYAAFMRRYATRYGRGGSFWAENRHLDESTLAMRDFEIWQFGNLPGQAPDGTTSAADYAATYAAARSAIRDVDPTARAVASLNWQGAGGRAADFLRAMAGAEPSLAGGLDAVYVFDDTSRSASGVESVLRDTHIGLEDSGNLAAPIRIGFGAPTSGSGSMSESDRAAFYAELTSRVARTDCGVDGMFAHAWTTPETDSSNPWHWYGIADPNDSSLSETAAAYRDAAAKYLGYADGAERAAVHPCSELPADRDGDGAADPADPAPLDPGISEPTASPPPAPRIDGTPSSPTSSTTATFSLSGERAVSFQCSLDGRHFENCGANPSYGSLGHGTHELRARSVDELGLVGPISTTTWEVDRIAPQVTSLSGPTGPVLDGRPRFEFTIDDPSASARCRLDGNPAEPCTSPKVYSGIGDGYHEFRVSAVDPAGNVSASRLHSFEVHVTPGPATITDGPSLLVPSDEWPRFSFRADWAVSFECRFDAQAFAACSGSDSHVAERALTPGTHSFEVRGVGGTGIRGASASRTFMVRDTQAPETTITSGPSGTIESDSAEFTLASSESGSTFRCSLDGAPFGPCLSTVRYSNLAEGEHVFRAAAADSAGNVDGTPASRAFTVRVVPDRPTVTIEDEGSPRPTFSFDAAHAHDYECRIDSPVFGPCSGEREHRPAEPLAPGRHVFAVRGIGATGKAGPQAERQFDVAFRRAEDEKAPDITIKRRRTTARKTKFAIKVRDDSEVPSVRCRVDKRRWMRCKKGRFTARKLDPGRHRLKVVARDAEGNVGRATHRWRVRRK